MSEYKEEDLPDLLPLYYNRLFPYSSMYTWLAYGENEYFARREISFTLIGDVYIRYQSFDNQDMFISEIQKSKPIKIDIGAVYNVHPNKRRSTPKLIPVEKEIVFDIDLTDYDDVRTCCSGAAICNKCWKFMVIACKILATTLKVDFGMHHLLWVFSGRRGIHCWVCDESVRKLNDEQRGAIAEYVQLIKSKKINLYGNYHPMISRSLDIIEPYFVDLIMKDQDMLGNDERIKKFLINVDQELREGFYDAMKTVDTSVERWNMFLKHYQTLSQSHKLPKNSRDLIAEIKLQYTYPRLDISVSKGVNHLLKAPFCVHPKTGKISIPFSSKTCDKFDPLTVPTLSLIVNEINAYDKKTLEQEKSVENSDIIKHKKIKDYKKTSLLKPVTAFNEFIEKLKLEKKIDMNF